MEVNNDTIKALRDTSDFDSHRLKIERNLKANYWMENNYYLSES